MQQMLRHVPHRRMDFAAFAHDPLSALEPLAHVLEGIVAVERIEALLRSIARHEDGEAGAAMPVAGRNRSAERRRRRGYAALCPEWHQIRGLYESLYAPTLGSWEQRGVAMP